MLRIISGKFRGRSIHAPDNNRRTRPTLDRVRETIFNIMVHNLGLPPLEEANVMDLFAGSGSLGFEALSRGAQRITFVDQDLKSLDTCRKNADTLDARKDCHFIKGDTRTVTFPNAPFDWVLIDPPYYKGMSEPTLENIWRQKALKPGGAIALEMAQDEHLQLPAGYICFKETTCGPGRLYILQFEPSI